MNVQGAKTSWWLECVQLQEARRFAALSEQMLMLRQQKQRRQMLHWWHLIAQDLHHHRYVHVTLIHTWQLPAAAFHANTVPSSSPCKGLSW